MNCYNKEDDITSSSLFFTYAKGDNLLMYQPLADRLRPKFLDDVAGQQHILGEKGVLRRIIQGGTIPNLIFYGPSGTGKTTVAEIQYFNKKQQQSLLEFMENGKLTLIASTTENPYFYVYNAVLSRSTVFEFKPLAPEDVRPVIQRGIRRMGEDLQRLVHWEDGVDEYIARSCGGDVRKSLNAVEALFAAHAQDRGEIELTLEETKEVAQRSANRYDRDGDVHYDILSAFQKSIRGSDPDAAIHYLARLLESGDLISPCRRLMVIASEDVGLAYPQAVPIVKACVDSANMLGLPEARIPLAEAVIFLATAPKSNSAIMAIDQAMADVRKGKGGQVPVILRDCHYGGAEKLGHGQGYHYAHNYPHHYVKQQYIPDDLVGKKYYEYGENKTEQAAKRYWDLIKGEV